MKSDIMATKMPAINEPYQVVPQRDRRIKSHKSRKSRGSRKSEKQSVMSVEARRALAETLKDMDEFSNSIGQKDTNNQSNDALRRQLIDNRKYYDRCITMISRDDSKLDDSNGKDDLFMEKNVRDESYFETNKKRPSESHHMFPRVSRFPILNSAGQSNNSKSTHSSAKNKHGSTQRVRLPGVGKYNIVLDTDSFQITQPGFDCRYDRGIYEEHETAEVPPRDIQEKAIKKCRKWLKTLDQTD